MTLDQQSFRWRIYLLELAYQTEVYADAVHEFREIQQALASDGDHDYRPNDIFLPCQNMVTAAAMMSKMIWPTSDKSRAKQRGRDLRALLGEPSLPAIQDKRSATASSI